MTILLRGHRLAIGIGLVVGSLLDPVDRGIGEQKPARAVVPIEEASDVTSPPASAICPNTVVGTTSPLFAINHSWVAGSNFGHHSSILMH